jgi:NitT/TauT family transport system permease protein
MAVDASALDEQVAGLDALELAGRETHGTLSVLWRGLWPKLAAVALALFAWQALVWSGWKSETILPAPPTVFKVLWNLLQTGDLYQAILRTMKRAVVGYGLSVVIGAVIGIAVARVAVLRTAIGSLITGLQTMPSIAWFPASIVLFGLSERAIMAVVILGAAPSIANGLIAGVDHVPPLLLRSGRMLGARGVALYRHVIMPASLPSFVGGLKQGWAFAWRSLMAGELIVLLGSSLGERLQFSRELSDYPTMYSWMIVILVIGIAADAVFSRADRSIRRRWGLIDTAA